MITTTELISVIASVISAIGGAFAAFAALRSANSAMVAQQAVGDAEHRASLRQISATATEVLVEVARTESRGVDLKRAYQTLFSFAGRGGSTSLLQIISEIDDKLKIASESIEQASLFTAPTKSLERAPPEETDRVQMKLSNDLINVRALREDIELKLASVEGQCATYREKAIQKPG